MARKRLLFFHRGQPLLRGYRLQVSTLKKRYRLTGWQVKGYLRNLQSILWGRLRRTSFKPTRRFRNFFRERVLFGSTTFKPSTFKPALRSATLITLENLQPVKGLKAKTLLFLLFLVSFCLTQGFALFFDVGRVPVFAQVPTEVSIVQGSPSPKTLVEQGKAFYDAGQYSEAAEVLQQAAVAFKTEGDVLREAMTLSNLSLAYQQLGLWSEAQQAIASSLNLLKSQENVSNSPKGETLETLQILAQTLDIQGGLQLSLGQPEQALNTWKQAGATYAQIGNQDGKTQSQINQAQAMQNLGLYPRACKTLLEAVGIDNQDCKISAQQLQTLKDKPASSLNVLALRSLGNILQLVGDLAQSQEILKQSLDLAQRLQSPPDISAALFSLGNTTRAQRKSNTDTDQAQQPTDSEAVATQKASEALAFYQQAATVSTSPITKIQAQLNQLSLLLEIGQLSEAQALWPQIQSQLPNLPPGRTAVYARINLAQNLIKLKVNSQDIAQQLATAVQQAKELGDQRAVAYALGNLGGLYEQTGQLSNAKDLTDQALLLAQTLNASDISYRWQWQLGRVLKAQGDREGAIAAYTSAFNTLKSLRSDLVSINPDVQFSFRESVEPVYRELVGLLLQSQGTQADEKNLIQARDVIESLQLAELVNFFRENCLNGTPIQIDQVDKSAAVIYPIVLEDRLEVVLSLPGADAPLRHYAIPRKREEVEKIFAQLRDVIAPYVTDPNRGPIVTLRPRENRSNPQQYLALSQQVYDWLIRPAEQDIAASGAKTLVFVLDSPLLNLPMAVLNDGKQFLIEKYAIAYTPGLQLLDPKPLARGKLTAFKGGVSEARQDFPPLPNVKRELEQIKSEVPGELLLNEQFTSTAIEKAVDSVPFPVVHLATHGQFSSKAEDTFILTWDDRLNVNQLNQLLRTREASGRGAIELLVLSACQTAAGDQRAALGLAGVAVRAGARSTLATLWFVNDEATAELMIRFYRELADTTITKAEALRRAQVSILQDSRYQQPIFWAPYVLVGNWL